MQEKIWKWGIIGPGNIARRFAEGLCSIDRAQLYAVASTDIEKAKAFAVKYGAKTAYGSHEEMLLDSNVEIVYISNLNPQHFHSAQAALLAGKHVLIEKPFTLNRREAEELFSIANQKNLYIMEGMWTRFHPITRKVMEWITEGKIGSLQSLHASFGFDGDTNPASRVISLEKGGSALLDIGVYLLSYAQMLFQSEPLASYYLCHQMEDTHVDISGSVSLLYKNYAFASLDMSIVNKLDNCATIFGSEGRIEVSRFYHPTSACLIKKAEGQDIADQVLETYTHEDQASGFEYEAISFMEILDQGGIENPTHTRNDILSVMGTMDSLRSQIQLIYPQERV